MSYDRRNGTIFRNSYRMTNVAGRDLAGHGAWCPVRLATTANIAGTYVASTKQLTVTATGALTVDSVLVANGDRLLLKDQTTGAEKGIYDVIVKGDTGIHPLLQRSSDANQTADFESGRLVSAGPDGTANANVVYQLATSASGKVLDTDAMPFGAMTSDTISAANVITALASAATAVDFNAQALTGVPSVSGASGVTLKRGATAIVDAGATTATAVTLAANKDLNCAAGTTAVDLSLGTGTFKTTTGAHTVNGAVTLAANKGIAASAGTGAFDLSLATGAMKTPTSSSNLFTFLQTQAAGAATNTIADPGGANAAIPVTASGVCAITTAGAETGTLAIPTFTGQWLVLVLDTDTSGARTITASQRLNKGGDKTITLTAAGDFVYLVALTIGGALRWQVVSDPSSIVSA